MEWIERFIGFRCPCKYSSIWRDDKLLPILIRIATNNNQHRRTKNQNRYWSHDLIHDFTFYRTGIYFRRRRICACWHAPYLMAHNVFWAYILERLPTMSFSYITSRHIYLYKEHVYLQFRTYGWVDWKFALRRRWYCELIKVLRRTHSPLHVWLVHHLCTTRILLSSLCICYEQCSSSALLNVRSPYNERSCIQARPWWYSHLTWTCH